MGRLVNKLLFTNTYSNLCKNYHNMDEGRAFQQINLVLLVNLKYLLKKIWSFNVYFTSSLNNMNSSIFTLVFIYCLTSQKCRYHCTCWKSSLVCLQKSYIFIKFKKKIMNHLCDIKFSNSRFGSDTFS